MKKVFLITQYQGDGYEGYRYNIAIFDNELSAKNYVTKYNTLLNKLKEFYSSKDLEENSKGVDEYNDLGISWSYKLMDIQDMGEVKIEILTLRS